MMSKFDKLPKIKTKFDKFKIQKSKFDKLHEIIPKL